MIYLVLKCTTWFAGIAAGMLVIVGSWEALAFALPGVLGLLFARHQFHPRTRRETRVSRRGSP